jgi:hypothetical protein
MRWIVVVVVVALLACGPDEPDQAVPQYSLAGGTVSCPNASDTSEFQSGGYHSFDCIWYCVTYKGQPSRYVDLTFEWNGSSWFLASEYVSSGICG